jgi:hypothetical protein
MLRLAKAFWDIALWRKTPAHLPASMFLLGLVAAVAALIEVVEALLPPTPSDRILTRVALSVGMPLAFTWAVLSIARHRQRFLQTGIALLGVAVLAEVILYPLGVLFNYVGSDHPVAIPLGLLLFVGFIWYLLACANIWRAALDSGLALGAAISIGYLLLSFALGHHLLLTGT